MCLMGKRRWPSVSRFSMADTTGNNQPGGPRLTRAPGHHVQTDVPAREWFTHLNDTLCG